MYKTDKETSQRMRRIPNAGTGPERKVGEILRGTQDTVNCNVKDLPGSPDFVLPNLGIAIFVHGCFWHRHSGCRLSTTPRRNRDLWERKFRATIERDKRNLCELGKLGWHPIVLWECEVRRREPKEIASTIGRMIREVGQRD